MSVERKKRYQMSLEIVYDDGEGFMSAPVVDISESGCFVETVMPLDPGTRVRLTPLLPTDAGVHELDGEVVRKNEYDLDNHFDRVPGMGIRFVDADAEQIEKLRALLEKQGSGS